MSLYIFDKNETTLDVALGNAYHILNRKNSFIGFLQKVPNFNDEPQFSHYVTSSAKGTSPQFGTLGGSLDENKAKLKALAESVERYSLHSYTVRNFVSSSFEKLNVRGLNPTEIITFSRSQLSNRRFYSFRINKNDVFRWVEGISLISNKPMWVPAQLVPLNYNFQKEKIIRLPISTGAAAGSSLAGATCRGVWECIERDAFIINYLNRLPREKIYTDDEDITNILKLFSKYKLEVYSFDITTDVKIPTIMSLIIDESGVGPAVTIGVKCNTNVKEALIGSVEEANQSRPHIRRAMILHKLNIKKNLIDDEELRMLYWKSPKMLRHLKFWLHSKEEKTIDTIKSYDKSAVSNLKRTVKLLQRNKLETVIVDCSKRNLVSNGFYTVKAIIPELQPFYLEEKYKYLGGQRLYKIPRILGYTDKNTTTPQLNRIPHPF